MSRGRKGSCRIDRPGSKPRARCDVCVGKLHWMREGAHTPSLVREALICDSCNTNDKCGILKTP